MSWTSRPGSVTLIVYEAYNEDEAKNVGSEVGSCIILSILSSSSAAVRGGGGGKKARVSDSWEILSYVN